MKTVKKSLKFLCVFAVLLATIQFMQPLIVKAEAAPPVSSVTIEGRSVVNQHTLITVRVVGYGSVYASIDGRSIPTHNTQLIGNPVHTFIYTFDCGILNNGSHQFIFRTTSHNRPWNTVTRVHNF
ncbi:MAG: hypothetical protein VZR06_00655 [Butyrivibrio sp.]|nr:hypothetical protein [Butyrivibrio sp.]